MNHSKANVIDLEKECDSGNENTDEGHDSADEVGDYIKEESNKKIIRKRFRFNLGKPDLGLDLPKGFLGSKEQGDKDINHLIAIGDHECLEDTIRSKIAYSMFEFMT